MSVSRCLCVGSALALIAVPVSGPAVGQIRPGHTLTAADGAIDVISGGRLWIGIQHITLDGISVPRPDEPCLRDGRDQGCAAKAKAVLVARAGRGDFRCELVLTAAGRPRMRSNRYAAVCYAGARDVNQELVARGWALAARGKSGDRYRGAERDARSKRLGLHATQFSIDTEPPKFTFAQLLKMLARQARRYPVAVIIAPWGIAVGSVLLLILLRWRARRQIARLQFELGKTTGLLEASHPVPMPEPEPIKRLAER